jgi:hypothetical protein
MRRENEKDGSMETILQMKIYTKQGFIGITLSFHRIFESFRALQI